MIATDPRSSFRFYVHDDPHPFASWNYHPEYEVHLVLKSTGRYVVGDTVGSYAPGQLTLVGPDLPHHWIADRGPDERIADAHAVLHFTDEWVRACQATMPELHEVDSVLASSAHGLEFRRETAARAATALLAVRDAAPGMERLVQVLRLLGILAAAPDEDVALIVPRRVPAVQNGADSDLIGDAVDYILENLTSGVRLHEAARRAAMSDSAFSRYFKAGAGQTFTDMVRQLRLTQACRLLEGTREPVASIAAQVGYANLSNFNRQFLRAYGMTPRRYRAECG